MTLATLSRQGGKKVFSKNPPFRLDNPPQGCDDYAMNNEPINMTATIARRIADLRATAPINMPDRPADRSRNAQRPPAPARRRRIIR
jgi:hypothetical protein